MDAEQRRAGAKQAAYALQMMNRTWDRFDAYKKRQEAADEPVLYPTAQLFGASSYLVDALAQYILELEARLRIDDFTKVYQQEKDHFRDGK